MSKLNFDEISEAKRIIEEGFDNHEATYNQLLILAKYYRWVMGYGEQRIKKMVIGFCNDHLSYFNEVVSREMIHDVVKKAMKYKPRELVRISITYGEVEKIRSIKNFKYEKILFTMLFLAKYHKLYPTTERKEKPKYLGYHLFESQKENIRNLCGMRISPEKLNMIFADFVQAGFIDAKILSSNKARYRILYADDESTPAIFIENLDDPTSHYISYCGGEKVYCEKCGKEIEKKGNKKSMCNDCFEKSRHEYQVNWMREKRKNRNVDK